ncbi:MAG: invasin domain 3-containing protein [Anaerolineae bacterium]
MRVAAFATLALGLVLAALWLVLGAPTSALAVGPAQAVDVVTIRMVQGNQPESLFPRGTKVVNGVVNYNIRDADNTPIARSTTISVLDPVGLEVYSSTFQTSTSYSGTATQPFSVSGDQMMAAYRTIATTQSQKAATDANAIPAATTSIDSAALNSVSAVIAEATRAKLATDRILLFTEIPTSTIPLLSQASTDLETAIERGNAIVTAGTCTPSGSQTCTAQVSNFNQNLQTVKDKTQSAATAIDTANGQLSGLSNLVVPAIEGCDKNALGQDIPRTYTSVVLQVVPPGTTLSRRDTWEWQVGTPSTIPLHSVMTAAPSTIYTLDVSVAPTHTSQLRASVLDVQCLPVPDGITVTFATTRGTLNPTSATTTSANGLHGLAGTSLQAGNQSGSAVVTLTGIGSQSAANVTIVGTASTVAFQVASRPLIIQRNASTDLQVHVVDANGNSVADGTLVQFTITNSAGTFNPVTASTVDGIARTTFTAGSTGTTAEITAQVPGTSAQDQLPVSIVGAPASISLGVTQGYSTTLYVNSNQGEYLPYTYIEATVKDADGNPVGDGTAVNLTLLAANKAVWDQPSPSNALQTQVITANGKASAKLTAIQSGANSSVGVVANVPGTNPPVIVLPSQALEITIKDTAPVTKTYSVYLPAIFKVVQCGRVNPNGGCQAKPPVAAAGE